MVKEGVRTAVLELGIEVLAARKFRSHVEAIHRELELRKAA